MTHSESQAEKHKWLIPPSLSPAGDANGHSYWQGEWVLGIKTSNAVGIGIVPEDVLGF